MHPRRQVAPAAKRGSVHEPERPLLAYRHDAEESLVPGCKLAEHGVRALCSVRGLKAKPLLESLCVTQHRIDDLGVTQVIQQYPDRRDQPQQSDPEQLRRRSGRAQ